MPSKEFRFNIVCGVIKSMLGTKMSNLEDACPTSISGALQTAVQLVSPLYADSYGGPFALLLNAGEFEVRRNKDNKPRVIKIEVRRKTYKALQFPRSRSAENIPFSQFHHYRHIV